MATTKIVSLKKQAIALPLFVPGYLRAELDEHVVYTLAVPLGMLDVGTDMLVHKTGVMRRRDGTLMIGDDPETIHFRVEGSLRMQCPNPVME